MNGYRSGPILSHATRQKENLQYLTPEPPSPTGQYPGQVWADSITEGLNLSSTGLPETGEEPQSPTGQYPDPVWFDVNNQLHGSAFTVDLEEAGIVIPEPQSPTGQYPDPVWRHPGGQSLSKYSGPVISNTDNEQAAQNFPISLKQADYSEDIGLTVESEQEKMVAVPETDLSNQEIYRIIREVARADSANALYSAVSADREYNSAGHPSYQQRHFGLAYGLLLFTQESGRLGHVLQLMKKRDPETFAELYGPDAETLLAVTNAQTPSERLQPVGGEPLWSTSWIKRFQKAGSIPSFQNAQNEEAIEGMFRPMLRIASRLGFITDRGLAMAFDRVVTQGVGSGVRWIIQAAGPLRTEAQRAHALETLGFKTIKQFQISKGNIPQHGTCDPQTYAAMVSVLRQQGKIPLPKPEEMPFRLLLAATGVPKRRLLRLWQSTNFNDLHYNINSID